MRKTVFTCLLFVLFSNLVLLADDAEATKVYQRGLEEIRKKEYYDALKSFGESELLAKSTTIRANSVRAQIGAAKLSELPYREFQLIEKLLARYPEFADVPALVKREYELGDIFYRGKREPAFYALRKLTWLTGPDKTEEIYTTALKRAPYSSEAPAARLRLAFIYDQKGEILKSLEQLRIVMQKFPESKSVKLAALALAQGCYELAIRGDGDGRYANECAEVCRKFLKKYPGDAAEAMIKRNLQRIRDVQARRIYNMAEFYRKKGRREAVLRYLAQVVKEYPETTIAPQAEAELAALDKTFIPGDFPAPGTPRFASYQTLQMPQDAEKILLLPGKNNNFLLPAPDLKIYMEDKKK